MGNWLLQLFAILFQGLRNPQKDKKDAELTREDEREIFLAEDPVSTPPPPKLPPVDPIDEEAKTPSLLKPVPPLSPEPEPPPEPTLKEKIGKLMESSGWEPPLEQLPRTRAQMYKILGNPGKGKPDKKFQREMLFVARNLPGKWNKGSQKLYLHKFFEPYLRQALWLTEMILGEVPIKRLGAYNFRHIRFDSSKPLSDHSWASAVDADPSTNNRAVFRYKEWQKKKNGKWVSCAPAVARRGPVTLPYDEMWIRTWPTGFPYELVACWLATGITWGATWSFPNDRWMHFVDTYGVGYSRDMLSEVDQSSYDALLKKWQRYKFIDNMHWECRDRQHKH